MKLAPKLHSAYFATKTVTKMFVIKKLSCTPDADVLHANYYGLVYPLPTHGSSVCSQGCEKYTTNLLCNAETV
jgi:hypothetical protein